MPPTVKRARKDGPPAAPPAAEDKPALAGNELLTRWRTNRATLPLDFDNRLLHPSTDPASRGDLFELEDDDAMERFAWAIPDERALHICASFAPLVEMGAGAGYWARLLRDRGVAITAFDRDVGAQSRAAGVLQPPWTTVLLGGPADLDDARFENHTLLLLYPDDLDARDEPPTAECDTAADGDAEFDDGNDAGAGVGAVGAAPGPALPTEALSAASLAAFRGEHVIHVGEWLGETLTLSMEGQQLADVPYAWGRSTDPSFQQLLAATFHKVLQVPLPNWGSVRNHLTVWKRTQTTLIDGDKYAHIPVDERLELAVASPSTRHLLEIPKK